MNNYQTQLTPEAPEKVPGKKRSAWLGFLIDTVETILLALVLFLGINAISSRVVVENISMKPTLQPGELLLVNKLAYKLGSPDHGDIIVFHYQGNPNEDYIKRLIGLPGDVVHVSEGVVYVNNFALNEPYIAAPPSYENTWTVPDGQFFVLGDNRNNSSDSHQWGFVLMEDVVGEAIFIYWPLDRIQSLNIPDLVQAAQ
ncbi:MAG: signal peptidase I [Chloroflexota bacterium]